MLFENNCETLYYYALIENKCLIKYLLNREIYGRKIKKILHPLQKADMIWFKVLESINIPEKDKYIFNKQLDKQWVNALCKEKVDPYLEIGAWRSLWFESEWEYLLEDYKNFEKN